MRSIGKSQYDFKATWNIGIDLTVVIREGKSLRLLLEVYFTFYQLFEILRDANTL